MRLAQLIAEANLAPADHTHDEISQIIDILQGPEEVGGVRSGGLVADVADIRTRINGDLQAELTPAQKVAIIVAGIGGLASVLNAWIMT